MDAALKKMCAFRKIFYLQLAALKDTRSGYLHSGKTTVTFGNDRLPVIEQRDKASTEFRHLCKGMRLAALVDCDNRGSFVHCERVGFEVPLRVGVSSSGLCE